MCAFRGYNPNSRPVYHICTQQYIFLLAQVEPLSASDLYECGYKQWSKDDRNQRTATERQNPRRTAVYRIQNNQQDTVPRH